MKNQKNELAENAPVASFASEMAEADLSLEDYISRSEEFWEEAVVNKVLSHFKILLNKKERQELCLRTAGSPKMSLAWFNQEFPSFPAQLATRKIPYLHKIDITKLMHENLDVFSKTPFFKAFAAAFDGPGDGRPRALVFPWHNLSAAVVLHDKSLDSRIAGAAFVYRIQASRGFSGCELVLEKLKSFLASLSLDWQPVSWPIANRRRELTELPSVLKSTSQRHRGHNKPERL